MTQQNQKDISKKKYLRLVEIYCTPTTRSEIKKIKGNKTYDKILRETFRLDEIKKGVQV